MDGGPALGPLGHVDVGGSVKASRTGVGVQAESNKSPLPFLASEAACWPLGESGWGSGRKSPPRLLGITEIPGVAVDPWFGGLSPQHPSRKGP